MQNQLWQSLGKSECDGFKSSLPIWLKEHMTEGMKWLLVHADDGIIWGRLNGDGKITLSSEINAFQPRFPSLACELQSKTIQQLRIFGIEGELLFWRKESRFQGRIIKDLDLPASTYLDEQHLLWGQRVMQAMNFTVLAEGQRGPVHAVPIEVPERRRGVLIVRHYISDEPSGEASSCMSRLVHLDLYRDKKEN